MKPRFLLGVMLFGGLWGFAEVALGGWLRATQPNPHLPIAILAVMGLVLLTAACVAMPTAGNSSAIAILAAAYCYVGTPESFEPAWATVTMGVSFDLVWTLARGNYLPGVAATASYLGLASFALIAAMLFHLPLLRETGWAGVIDLVGFVGTIVAAVSAMLVPLVHQAATAAASRPGLRLCVSSWARGTLAVVTMVIWGFVVGWHLV